MDVDGSGNINIKELIDFLEAVGGGEIDKKVVSQSHDTFTKVTLDSGQELTCYISWHRELQFIIICQHK